MYGQRSYSSKISHKSDNNLFISIEWLQKKHPRMNTKNNGLYHSILSHIFKENYF